MYDVFQDFVCDKTYVYLYVLCVIIDVIDCLICLSRRKEKRLIHTLEVIDQPVGRGRGLRARGRARGRARYIC